MSSIHEQILDCCEKALSPLQNAGINVSRSRETFLSRSTDRAVGIFPGDESDSRFSDRCDKHEFVMNVFVFCRGDPWYTVADEVVCRLHKILMTDMSLLSMITSIRRISRGAVDDETDLSAGEYRLEYLVSYLTKSVDISSGI